MGQSRRSRSKMLFKLDPCPTRTHINGIAPMPFSKFSKALIFALKPEDVNLDDRLIGFKMFSDIILDISCHTDPIHYSVWKSTSSSHGQRNFSQGSQLNMASSYPILGLPQYMGRGDYNSLPSWLLSAQNVPLKLEPWKLESRGNDLRWSYWKL